MFHDNHNNVAGLSFLTYKKSLSYVTVKETYIHPQYIQSVQIHMKSIRIKTSVCVKTFGQSKNLIKLRNTIYILSVISCIRLIFEPQKLPTDSQSLILKLFKDYDDDFEDDDGDDDNEEEQNDNDDDDYDRPVS